MPQETNLNVAPYFDDYNSSSDYYKVLFKPAYPVQARELNNLQSILQNQIEQFGDHTFKEGAKVIPGQLTYLKEYQCIQIEETFLGVPVGIYLEKIVGQTITGASSGVTAQVVNYITNQESEKGNYTLYINYFESSTTDADVSTFIDDEVLLLGDSITYATTFIATGEGFAKAITEEANAIGSAYNLSEGVYYLRGHFVSVYDDTLILDQYTNTPSYRIGLNVKEEVISSEVDPELNDNAQGFTNYAAPGADRLKITATLAKKLPDDFEDTNFIQLSEVKDGVLRENKTTNNQYEILGDEMARRTFDESGHYYVKPYQCSLKESLNNKLGNRGLFESNQTTEDGNTPSDDLAVVKILPGKAYVKGYEVNTVGPIYLDSPKPRTTKTLKNRAVNFGFGPSFTLNRVTGSPTIAINSDNYISMRSKRRSSGTGAQGIEIGVCRVYDFVLESGSYDTTAPELNQWDIALFDVQTYTSVTLNRSISLPIPTYVEGKNSGATAFLRNAASNTTSLTLYDVKGEFVLGEKLIFNSDESLSRTIVDITNYEVSDVQSLRQGTTFLGDIIPSTKETVGIASISSESGSESIITSPSVQWVGIASVGNLVQYSVSTNNVPSLARVKDVTLNELTIEAVPDLPSFRIGNLPTSNINVTDLKVVETKKQKSNSGGNASDGESIFSVFSKSNVESVDLTSSTLIFRKEFTVNISGNKSDSVSTGSNETFMPFDEERYTLVRSDGSFEVLTQDKFNFSAGNTGLIIKGLGSNDTGARLMTTIKKSKVTEKVKRNNISGSVIIDKSTNPSSGTGSDTSNDGLTHGNYPFGTRVQDDAISLGVPDVQQIYAIYESEGTADPAIPSVVTSFLDGPTKTTDDLIVGELFIGATSGAIGFYFQKNTDVSVDFIARNEAVFEDGETITFQTSGITAQVASVDVGDEDITQNFSLTQSQRKSFYDVSRIERIDGTPTPSSKIRVCFSYLDYDSSDDGDITVTNSYNNVKYSNISEIDGFRNSDLVDARPRVSQYNVAEDTRSPFEFFGRSFTGGQHSSKEVLASDETMVVDYSYYLPRADRVYVDKEGDFSLKFGTPADRPQLPDPISNQMEIATVTMPAYLFNVGDAEIRFVEHKRYQMSDIAKLEKRISNLEYYSALSQLETATVNQFTPDANGLNRFKSGIFVDNFTSLRTQDPNIGIKNCIDRKTQSLRPSHYTNSVDLQLGTTDTTNSDSKFAPIDGENVVRNENVLMLQYEEQEWLKNPFATRVVNVTPYMVTFWAGSVALTPDTDVWIDVNIMEPNVVDMGDSGLDAINAIMGFDVVTNEDGSRTGIGPVVWDSWETVGVQRETDTVTDVGTDTRSRSSTRRDFGGRRRDGNRITTEWRNTTNTDTTTTTTTTDTTTTTTSVDQERAGNQLTLSESTQTESLGSAVVSREVIHYMRSRNIECVSTSMKPYTRFYSFFDNMDVNKYCTPKLIEIQMNSGTFQVGETVRGYMPSSFNIRNVSETSIPNISFRVAVSNHKYGPYNNASTVYDSSPYNKDLNIPPSYSETSSILNVDTFSLQDEKEPDYSGYIAQTMILVGQSSGAQATVTNVRLISDRVGTMIYNFLVPSSNDSSTQVFETGQSRMRLTTSNTNSKVEGIVTSSAEATFYSQGTLDNTQETTLSLKNLETGNIESSESRTLTSTDVSVDVSTRSSTTRSSRSSRSTTTQVDPLAQSFFVDDLTGVFISSIDVFFQSKPTTARTPVICQLREMELGTPTTKILPYSNVEVDPINITTSQDASVPTNIKFKAPVYLNPQTEYCVVFLSHNTEYTVWVSKLGEPDISTIGSEEGQVLVSTQPLLGSLFKSQNASTWTPSQYEDLTFTLYRSDFATQGNAQFYNPNLPKNIELISKDNVRMISKEVKLETSAVVTADIKPGETVTQANTNATGNFQNFGGSASGSLTITNVGVGYTPSDSSYYTFTGVALTSITGSGINATADITVSDGIAIGATIANGGTGHQIGDLLAPISIGNDSLGVSMSLTVDALSGTNQLVLSGVQGDFSTNTADTLSYKPTAGVSSALSVYPLSPIDEINNGKEFIVNFRNHGMHSTSNLVKLSGLEGTRRVKLASAYPRTSTGAITIVSTTGFTQFEGVNVGANNPGYIRIGNEIISYTGTSGNTLTGITRGVDNTVVQAWANGSLVRKYEMNGVSLRRINAEHYLGSSGDSEAITLDSYKIEIDMSDTTRGINRTSSGSFRSLHFNKTRNGGGINGRSTYNQQFELIIPKFTYITPQGTSVSGTIRTTSGTSISGSEPSFIDQGFSDLTFNGKNYFDSPRIIGSRVNELLYLNDQPKNKSLTVNVNLSSDDSRLTPMFDLDKTSCTFTTNRVNSVIENYADDFRANTVKNDPTKFIYTHRSVVLENPATSIEVTLDAYITNDHDIRLFYALDQDVPLKDIVFIPFPGYKNQDPSRPGAIKDPSKSDGTSDTLTPKSDSSSSTPAPAQFTEYKFSADLLPQFTQFKIKVLATSTNQAVVPQIRNIRVVSLA